MTSPLRVLELVLDRLADAANNQARIASDTNQSLELRDQASVHYGAILLVSHAISDARNAVLGEELAALEEALQAAAPPGATPRLRHDHPSVRSHLHLVEEDHDDSSD